MHSCPRCGQACDCDGEDLWNSMYDHDPKVADSCQCQCPDEACPHGCSDAEYCEICDEDPDHDDMCVHGVGPEGWCPACEEGIS